MATKDGLPRKAFAYAPSNDPTTWKLPFLTADGKPDPAQLPAAAGALSEAGIPADALVNVKSRLRAAYRKWKGSDVEYPEGIREAEFREADDAAGITIREATILLDKSPVDAKVIFQPNGDALVVPCYDGEFWWAKRPWEPPKLDDDPTDWSAKYDAQDATDVLQRLYRLKGGETDQPEQMALIDQAINGILRFLKAEGDEIGQPVQAAEAAHELIHAQLVEIGARNSTADLRRIQGIHDFCIELGATCSMVEAARAARADEPVAVAEGAEPSDVTFRESAGDSAAVVTLAEANPIFDRATKTVTITPIRPGWGNKRDNYYYPREALREATEEGLFNHIKMFRDHPRKSDERDLPERSVKDWFATTREAYWDAATGEPRVPVVVHDDDVLRRFEEAPEQIAFSILGAGTARKGKVGNRDGKIVESFHHVRSVDWVTEAGAGGALAFAESAAEEHEQMAKDIENLTAEQLKEANPKLYAELTALREHAEGEGTAPAGEGKIESTPAGGTDAPAASEPPATEPAAKPEPEAAKTEPEPEAAEPKESGAFISRAEFEEALTRLRRPDAIAAGKKAVEAELAESTLPKKAKDAIAERFVEAGWGNGFVYTDEPALRTAVKSEIGHAEKLLEGKPKASKVTGMGATTEGGDADVRESVTQRLETKWGNEAVPKARVTVDTGAGEPIAESSASRSVEDRMAAKLG